MPELVADFGTVRGRVAKVNGLWLLQYSIQGAEWQRIAKLDGEVAASKAGVVLRVLAAAFRAQAG